MAHASWGPGWPNCSSGKIKKDFAVSTVQGTVKFPGGVRYEIVELVMRLVQETARRGYRFGVTGNPSYGCWGYNCRAIAGTSKPSNHSWGLAVDINAPRNPMSRPLKTDMPSWMPALWKDYGFRWGGTYTTTPDSMHYEFLGSVEMAKVQTQKARTNHLGEAVKPPIPLPPKPQPPKPTPIPPPEDDDMQVQPYAFYRLDNDNKTWLVPSNHEGKRHVPDPAKLEIEQIILYVMGVSSKSTGWNGEVQVLDDASDAGKWLAALPVIT